MTSFNFGFGLLLTANSYRNAQRLRPTHEFGPGQRQGDHPGSVTTSSIAVNACADLRIDDEGNMSTRSLGLLVARGTLLVLLSPVDGSEEIENPFVQGDDDD